MAWVLAPLLVLALADGLLNLPGGFGKNFLGHYLAPVPGARPDLGAPVWLEWAMGVGSAFLVVVMTWVTYRYYRRPRRGLRPWLHELLFQAFYLDRFYLAVVARPYQQISLFLWQRVDNLILDRGYIRLAQGVFRPYRALARFLWQELDQRVLDEGIVRTASGFLSLSALLGLWATGRLSTYLQMLLLGLAVWFGALAVSWYLW
jgi:NADH:ubiquinone oxidoreductase subunit 5 (subunit L)/multisubunit Na+/H+ antiporter MnhA subunit